jgi:NADPH:quinone reductase-like Zn-dependent oxidoreductase
MRIVTQSNFGGPEVLKVSTAERPKALPTEVVVRVKAIGINPIEAFIRSGAFPMLGAPPFILGWDISGVIEEIVPGVNRFKVGDEVFGMPLFPRQAGAYAEYFAAPSRQLAFKPKSIDHAHAAALPLVGLTAYQSLIEVAAVHPGQRVLIHGAAGGLGHIAVQLAKFCGAEVIATASASKHAFLRSLGVDQIIDYTTVDFAQAAREIDVVLETIGNGYAQRSLPTLKDGGLLITVVERTNADLEQQTIAAGKRFAGIAVEPDYVALEWLAELVDTGKLKIHVDRTFPMEGVAAAHNALNGSGMGKIVITP